MTFKNTYVKIIKVETGDSIILKWKLIEIKWDKVEFINYSENDNDLNQWILLQFKAQIPLKFEEFTSLLIEEDLKITTHMFPSIKLQSESRYIILLPNKSLYNFNSYNYFVQNTDKNEIVELINKLKFNPKFHFWLKSQHLLYLKEWVDQLSPSIKCTISFIIEDYIVNKENKKELFSDSKIDKENLEALANLEIVEILSFNASDEVQWCAKK